MRKKNFKKLTRTRRKKKSLSIYKNFILAGYGKWLLDRIQYQIS